MGRREGAEKVEEGVGGGTPPGAGDRGEEGRRAGAKKRRVELRAEERHTGGKSVCGARLSFFVQRVMRFVQDMYPVVSLSRHVSVLAHALVYRLLRYVCEFGVRLD